MNKEDFWRNRYQKAISFLAERDLLNDFVEYAGFKKQIIHIKVAS